MSEPIKPNITLNDLVVGYTGGSRKFTLPVVTSASTIPGEIVAVIGPNGSGKSTLLRTIAGLQLPVSGNISFDGKSYKEMKSGMLAHSLAFVGTEQIRVPGMRVKDLVTLGRYPHTGIIGVIKESDRRVVEQVINLIGIADLSDRLIDELSDGERQRGMIARVLAQTTPVLVLDEPTAYLDLSNKYDIVNLLAKIARTENKTVIFSTHDVHYVMPRVDKIWLLSGSGLVEGAPEDIMLSGIMERTFPTIKSRTALYGDHESELSASGGGVRVEGEPEAKAWTIRALHRKGISVTETADCTYTINVSGTFSGYTWHLTGDGLSSFSTSIYDLLTVDALKSYFPE